MKYKFLVASFQVETSPPAALKYCETEKEAKEYAATGFSSNKGGITYVVYKATQMIAPIIPAVTFTDVT